MHNIIISTPGASNWFSQAKKGFAAIALLGFSASAFSQNPSFGGREFRRIYTDGTIPQGSSAGVNVTKAYLAKSGVFCSQGYVASAVCSPSRAGLMTGRDPRRFGYEGNLNKGAANYATRPELLGLPPGEHTLADHLKQAGYATALICKWHL